MRVAGGQAIFTTAAVVTAVAALSGLYATTLPRGDPSAAVPARAAVPSAPADPIEVLGPTRRMTAEALRRVAGPRERALRARPVRAHRVVRRHVVVRVVPPSNPAYRLWRARGLTAWLKPNGRAIPPPSAPPAVKNVVYAANRIARRPYLWGGGHASWFARGYDCSGSVSYALAYGGLLGTTLTSGQFMNWGVPGPGRWITVYANEGHVFMVVAGLRFDTSGRGRGPGSYASRWQLTPRSAAGFTVRHFPGL